LVSPWFKRRMTARLVVAGSIVLVAVCLAFGEAGIAVGVVAAAGFAVVVSLQRRRRWRKGSTFPPPPPS
jgi:O-antigen ligase